MRNMVLFLPARDPRDSVYAKTTRRVLLPSCCFNHLYKELELVIDRKDNLLRVINLGVVLAVVLIKVAISQVS